MDPVNLANDPLVERYASREMVTLFSPRNRIRTWRLLWIALAEGLKEAGVPITQEQIDAMQAALDKIDFAKAAEFEAAFRHDVMAHIHAFGLECPAAMPIIHLGATSAFVTDNTDLILIRDGLGILVEKTVRVLRILRERALQYRALPVLSYTHFQPAQLTTLGKRVCLWAQDVMMDLADCERVIREMRFRSAKGTTGTQASYLTLLGDDPRRVFDLEADIANRMGFAELFPVTGQTYPRKLDYRVFSVLSGMGQSASKFASDIRLLAHTREVEEPMGTQQVGSSAMAYKRNPMRSERISSLSRYLIILALNPAMTAASQWFERTLDDSANRRLALPRGFMLADAILALYANVAAGFKVNDAVIAKKIADELPFQISEAVIMKTVAAGGDRQQVHERLRQLSLAVAGEMKGVGAANDLLDRIAADPFFGFTRKKLEALADPARLTGMAELQVTRFVEDHLDPLLERFPDTGTDTPDLKV